MYEWVRAYGNGSTTSENIAIFYFVLLMIFGNIVLFSLFTAILLRNFEGDDDEEEDEEEAEDEGGLKRQGSITQKLFSKETCQAAAETFKEAFGKKKRVPKMINSEGKEIKLD